MARQKTRDLVDLQLPRPWDDIPPALLNKIDLKLMPLIVHIGPAQAVPRACKRYGHSPTRRAGSPHITFHGSLTRQAKLFWGQVVLRVYRAEYILIVSAMLVASAIDTAPDPGSIDPNGGYPISWMRKYREWLNAARDVTAAVDRGIKDEAQTKQGELKSS